MTHYYSTRGQPAYSGRDILLRNPMRDANIRRTDHAGVRKA